MISIEKVNVNNVNIYCSKLIDNSHKGVKLYSNKLSSNEICVFIDIAGVLGKFYVYKRIMEALVITLIEELLTNEFDIYDVKIDIVRYSRYKKYLRLRSKNARLDKMLQYLIENKEYHKCRNIFEDILLGYCNLFKKEPQGYQLIGYIIDCLTYNEVYII